MAWHEPTHYGAGAYAGQEKKATIQAIASAVAATAAAEAETTAAEEAITAAETAIAAAITTMGGTVAEGAELDDFPDAIATIPTGGDNGTGMIIGVDTLEYPQYVITSATAGLEE